MPNNPRTNAVKPLFNYIIDIGEQLDILCSEMAIKMAKEVGNKEFNNLIAEASTVVDILGSVKMRKCLTCMTYLDRLSENKKEIKKELASGKV